MGGSIMDQNSQSENLCGQCRICMDIKTNQISIFKDDLSEKIAQLADIEIHTDDGLPTSICTDCEVRLNKCYEFREEVRYADRKFREGPSYSQVDIEECVVKEEIGGYSSNYASTIDEENYNSATEVDNSENEEEQRSDEHEIEASVDPLSHVEVMDVAEQSDKTSIPEDSMGLEEPLIEARPELVPATDPLSTEMESARKETDSKPSTSTAVWKTDTPRELPNHISAADICERSHEKMVAQLNEDVEFLVACNMHVQSNFNQQLSSNITKQSKNNSHNPQFRHNEIATHNSKLYPGQNLFSNRNDQYSRSFCLPQENQIGTNFTKQISTTAYNQMQIAHQYRNMKSPSFNNVGIHNNQNYQLSYNNIPPYHINPQKWNVGYNNTANESQTYYPAHPVVQPSHNTVPAPLLGSNFSPIIANVVSSKIPFNIPQEERGLPIHGTEGTPTNKQFPIPASTNSIHNSKTIKGNKSRNKREILRPSKQTVARTIKKLRHPVVIKKVSDSHCEVCNFDYDTVVLLTEHKRGNSFICRKCAVSFNDHKLLEEHFATHAILFKCATCGLNFYSRGELVKHEKDTPSCTPQPVICTVCKQPSKNKKSLRAHIKIKHGGGNYQCVVCGKSWTYPYLLNAHLRSAHTAYEHIKCEHCTKVFYGPDFLKTHVLNTHTMRNDSVLSVTCPKCGLTLKNEATVKTHILKHDRQVCELCGESFQGPNSLKYHKEIKHPIKGIFSCPQCDKKFTLSSDLVRHKLTQHKTRSKLKPKFCEICGKMYKGRMKNHLLMHSGEKNFECPICKQRFNQRVTRDTHMRVHSDVGKYLCNSCGKTFRWKQTMDKHVNKCSHTSYNID